jgi:hypothetical protein
MPGTQGQLQVAKNKTITQQQELLVNRLRSIEDVIIISNTTQPRVSYLRLHMAQPKVPDETEIMKFRYAIRMSAETRVRFHLFADYVGEGHKQFWVDPRTWSIRSYADMTYTHVTSQYGRPAFCPSTPGPGSTTNILYIFSKSIHGSSDVEYKDIYLHDVTVWPPKVLSLYSRSGFHNNT